MNFDNSNLTSEALGRAQVSHALTRNLRDAFTFIPEKLLKSCHILENFLTANLCARKVKGQIYVTFYYVTVKNNNFDNHLLCMQNFCKEKISKKRSIHIYIYIYILNSKEWFFAIFSLSTDISIFQILSNSLVFSQFVRRTFLHGIKKLKIDAVNYF